MTNLSNKILDKIKKEKMIPKSRWHFIMVHTLLGTAILTSIIIGSIAVAIVIRHCTATDWELARQFTGGHLRSFIMIIPYLWIIFIGLTIFLADLLFKHTKKGYRIKPWKIVAVSILFSMIGGVLFYLTKADRPIEEGIRNNLTPYHQWEIRRNEMFAAPEKGVLAGEIIEINPEEEWIVVDFKNNKWIVDVSEAKTPVQIIFEIGMQVGMMGEMIDHGLFKAERIAPWRNEIRPTIHLERIKIEINERKL